MDIDEGRRRPAARRLARASCPGLRARGPHIARPARLLLPMVALTVVGAAVGGCAAPSEESSRPAPPAASTVVAAPGTLPLEAPPAGEAGRGEAGSQPFTVPATGAPGAPVPMPTGSGPPGSGPSPETAAVDAVVHGFLTRYWSDEPRTYAQLADAVAPYATEGFVQPYRDPAQAPLAVNGGQSHRVDGITTRVVTVAPPAATVAATGTSTDPVLGPRVLKRTLELQLEPDGVWRVGAIR